MVQPKFNKDDKVKFSEDHDGLAGNVVSFTYDSEKGCVYTISSKYFDSEKNDMVEGIKICREDELVAVEEVA